QVSLESNHLGCKFMESLCPALRISAFNDGVLPLFVPEFPEALKQCLINVLLCLCDEGDPPQLARLLRARRERPRDRRAAECGQQFPPSDGDCHTPLPREVRKGRYHATSVQSSRSGRAGWRLLPLLSSASTAHNCRHQPLTNAAIAASRVAASGPIWSSSVSPRFAFSFRAAFPWNGTGARAFYCRPPHGNTFNQGNAVKRGGSPEPRSRDPHRRRGSSLISRRQLLANAAIAASRVAA